MGDISGRGENKMKVELVCIGDRLNSKKQLDQYWMEYRHEETSNHRWSYKKRIAGASPGAVYVFEMTGEIHGTHTIKIDGPDAPTFSKMHPNSDLIAEWSLQNKIATQQYRTKNQLAKMGKEHDVLKRLDVFRDKYKRATITEKSAIIMLVIRYIMGGIEP